MNKAFNFIKSVLTGSETIPPEKCIRSLNSNFGRAKNIDWFRAGQFYEAVFYKDNIEHIAVFSTSGSLQEYKMYLPLDFLPVPIRRDLENRGEIMNIVFVNKRYSFLYEAIYRDSDLNRYMILLNEFGVVIEERQL